MDSLLSTSDARMHPITLRFPRELEEDFFNDYFQKSLMQLRFAIIFAILLYALFGIFDAWITPEIRNEAWLIRYAIALPAGFMYFIFTYSPHFKKYMQQSLFLLSFVPGLGVLVILLLSPLSGSYVHNAGLMLIMMYTYVLIRLRFVYASIASWTIVALYAITTLWIRHIPFPVFLSNGLLFVVANFVGMISSYQMEKYIRREFIQTIAVKELEQKRHLEESKKLQEAVDAATKSLQENEAKFRTLAETTAAGIFIHRGETLLYMNPAIEAMGGYTREELLTVDPFDLIHPEYRQLVWERFQARLRGEEVPHRYEVRFIAKNGEDLWVLLCAGMINYEGKPAIIGTLFDITDLKKAEEEKTRLYEENIKHCQTILEDEKKFIQEKEKMLRDLHDGLGSITTNISFLSELSLNKTEISTVQKNLATISKLAKEGLSEIRGFVHSLDSRETNWQSLIAEFRHYGATMVEPHGMAFSMTVTVDNPLSPVNTVLYLTLFRIYKEAITNCIKHSGAHAVNVALSVMSRNLNLTFHDDGTGFCGERSGGRGIPSMRKRAEELGGTLAITTEQGTCLQLEVPLPQKYPGQRMELCQ